MAELFMLNGTTTVLSVGVVRRFGEDVTPPADPVLASRNCGGAMHSEANAAIAVPAIQGTVRALLNDALANRSVVKLAVGFDDGTAAPTAAAGEFVLPTTRSYETITCRVADLTDRLTDTGPMTIIHYSMAMQSLVDWYAGVNEGSSGLLTTKFTKKA